MVSYIKRRIQGKDNKILRRIFGPKRDEKGVGRRLHKDELIVYTVHLI